MGRRGACADSSTDGTSELSIDTSSSLWSHNPIASHFRVRHREAQRLQAAQIANTRRIQAELLQPRDLPANQRTRLEELKKAKERRMGTPERTKSEVSIESSVSLPQTVSRSFSHKLDGIDSKLTRSFVILALVFCLFVLLQPDFIQACLPIELVLPAAWHSLVLQDVCVIAYMVVCAVPHFFICDLAFVYAFDAMELGAKTGQQVKKFYSDKVRLGVAVGSLGIVTVSILKAVVKVWVRGFLWGAVRAYTFLRETSSTKATSLALKGLQHVPLEVRATCYVVMEYVRKAMAFTGGIEKLAVAAPIKVCQILRRYLLQSNFIGRNIEGAFEAITSTCLGISQQTRAFVIESIDAFEGKVTIASWRMEALDASRSLFSYTAVFLLTTLVLFHFSSQKSGSGQHSSVQQKLTAP